MGIWQLYFKGRTLSIKKTDRSKQLVNKKWEGEPGLKKKKIAAFFDVDGTLIYKDSQALEAKFILKKENLSLGYLGKILLTLFALQLNRMGWISLSYQNKVYIKTYRGRTRQWLEKMANDLFSQVIEKKLIPRSLALIHGHRKKGDLIVLVSACWRRCENVIKSLV